MSNFKKIAIIPARGGSKRIPRKNIRDFLNMPIIVYSIQTAISSGLFDEVMVSTDDDEIANISKRYGAQVPFYRSEINSNDFATTFDVIEEVINEYNKLGFEFEYTCCLYPCAPFVEQSDLVLAYNKLINFNYDCVFPMVEYHHPIQRALKISANNRIEMLNPENMQLRSQDFEKRFHDTGQFYFFNTSKIINERKIWTDNTGGIEWSEVNCQDIDSLEDWEIAELKFKRTH